MIIEIDAYYGSLKLLSCSRIVVKLRNTANAVGVILYSQANTLANAYYI